MTDEEAVDVLYDAATRAVTAEAAIQRVQELKFVPIVTGDQQIDQMLRVQVLKDQDNLQHALDGPDE